MRGAYRAERRRSGVCVCVQASLAGNKQGPASGTDSWAGTGRNVKADLHLSSKLLGGRLRAPEMTPGADLSGSHQREF